MTPVLESYIAGEWVQGRGREVPDVNPARPSDVLATFRLADAEQLDQAVEAAVAASRRWARTPAHERAAILACAADLLEARTDRYAPELTREQGKTLAEATGEVRRAAAIFRYNAAVADEATGEVYASPRARERILRLRVPVGPAALITPWNVPIAIPAWKLAPALVNGNTVVWKPASLVPLLAVRLMEVLGEAGLPPGVCNLVLASGRSAEALVAHDDIRACSFTGSTAVGKRLLVLGAQSATRMQTEMGGKNAAVVLADADLDHAVGQVLSGAMLSTGQRCTATSRALVARPVFDDFVERLTAGTAALRVGDPTEPATQVGPVASADQHRQVLDYYRIAGEEGGRILTGGGSRAGSNGGYFVEPTVVVDVEPTHRVFMEEVFGPLVAVMPIDGIEDGFALANRGRYGLAGAVFTRDLDTALEAVDEFDVGVLHINSETCGADPHVPFGGFKDSGSGEREMGTLARDFYTQSKTVYVREAGGP